MLFSGVSFEKMVRSLFIHSLKLKIMAKWYGTKEIEMIYHGDWADPELKVDERTANYYDVEQYCVDCMKEEGLDYNNDDIFGEWVRNHEEEIIDWIYEITVVS